MNKKTQIYILIITLAVLILAGIIGFYFWSKIDQEQKNNQSIIEQQDLTSKEILIPLDVLGSDEKLLDYIPKNIFPIFVSPNESPNKLNLFHIQDYQSGENFIVGVKSLGWYYGAHYFVINKKTGLLKDQEDDYCGIDFSNPIYIASKKSPFFEAECALANRGSEGKNLFFLFNGELKSLGTFSEITDNSKDETWVTTNIFKDLDNDNNLEIIESGKHLIYVDSLGGQLKESNDILNIYKWDEVNNIFVILPKTDKIYSNNNLLDPK